MEGFGDVFADVHFDDAAINLNEDGGNPGTTLSGDAGKTDTGQLPASPAGPEKQGAGDKPPEDDKGAKPAEKADGEKPAPYDQDPKWKKARAAEAALDSLKEELGILDIEELKELAKQGVELSKVLKGKDVSKVLEDAEYARKVRDKWDEDERAKGLEDEDPDSRTSRLEKELASTRKALEDYKTGVEDQEHAQKVITNFGKEIHKVIAVEGENAPFTDAEHQLLQIYLGIDNPANMIDIEDTTAVRKMALNGTKQFRTLVRQIQDAAVENYVAGKKSLAGDTGKPTAPAGKNESGQAPVISNTGREKPSGPLTAQEVDTTFDNASREFAEVLVKGLAGLT